MSSKEIGHAAHIAALRREYEGEPLGRRTAPKSPHDLFDHWFRQALEAEVPDVNAMSLATASADGRPSVRIVLLKGYDERGIVFYTNYRSAKAADIEANPHVAVALWWPTINRQIRVQGRAERVDAAESDEYFASRPRGSQLGAWASDQSSESASRRALEAEFEAAGARFENEAVPRPDWWGGYRILPSAFEFWQGRPSRLHDRLRYARDGDGWAIRRLDP